MSKICRKWLKLIVMAHEVMEAQLCVGQVEGSRVASCRSGVKMFIVTDGTSLMHSGHRGQKVIHVYGWMDLQRAPSNVFLLFFRVEKYFLLAFHIMRSLFFSPIDNLPQTYKGALL